MKSIVNIFVTLVFCFLVIKNFELSAQGSPHWLSHPKCLKLPPFLILNLDRSQTRLAFQLEQMNKHGLNWQRIAGVDGSSFVSKYEIHGYPYKKQVLNETFSYIFAPKLFGRGLAPGEIGCFYGHLRALKWIVESNEEWTVVLEDDAILSDKFADSLSRQIIELPPDADILYLFCYLGACATTDTVIPMHGVTNMKACSGAHNPAGVAYLINRRAAQLILRMVESVDGSAIFAIDSLMAILFKIHKKVTAYCTVPELVTTGRHGSEIDQRGSRDLLELYKDQNRIENEEEQVSTLSAKIFQVLNE